MKNSLKLSRSTRAVILSIFALVLTFFVFRTNIFVSGPNQTFLTSPIPVVVMPHHDLAATLRSDLLSQVWERISPKTIILVSPNHFEAGGYNILTTNRQWRLNNAYFESDTNKISTLDIRKDDLAFDREHGIFNQLEPLKNVFPDAKIVPIIIKQNTPAKQLDELNVNLIKTCKADCLVVASVDFSHYQPASVASIHDLLSIKALSNLEENLVWQAEIDSNPTLYLATKFAKARGAQSFHLAANTNSGLMESSPDAESTSYVLGWFDFIKTEKAVTETFTVGYNLEKLTDTRFVRGTDQEIDLADSRSMALLCNSNPDYCALNRLLWGPTFYRDILNGLVVVGEIQANQYKLVLVPTKNNLALRGADKLAVINKIRTKLNLSETTISDGYDTILISK
jgi:AmmeMemoRadiSam system protein B